jgi:hypothetical protein
LSFTECFANGVDRDDAAILFAMQRPAAPAQFAEPSGPPAWRTVPTWSLIGTQDAGRGLVASVLVSLPGSTRAYDGGAALPRRLFPTGPIQTVARFGDITIRHRSGTGRRFGRDGRE